MSDLRIGIVGCAGRMGRMLVNQVSQTAGCQICGGTEPASSDFIGQDIMALAGLDAAGICVSDDTNSLFQQSDAVIDFTTPTVSVANAKLAAKHHTIHVIGTTGLSNSEQAEITACGNDAVIVQGANMSLGVNLLAQMTKKIAALLDDDFDIEVLEMHHHHKVDAPSGTALLLGKAAAEGRDVDHDTVADRGRDGITGARKKGDIGYAVLRGGNVVGEHTVMFAADNERIEITHKAGDRSIFARGAVRAALWAQGKPAGNYDMMDVLGLGD
ncbi:4-hydroxy-tetrahydrodipicolinate reductase [Sneathiella marina]|uniref:4-hydroxy-tetrahydrodipicolinate reductase n=1 Tax=Sneathiella marina TaxID=2950108 RepID=A0ABY4W2H2_9PROT|nr:4-hydroxy-tetrahydrodipicolinate reductase [Sneathiella marina]USG61147.1 4-hydroxy-tetrahydrodipicolinate reductase [Sneathiella marina]